MAMLKRLLSFAVLMLFGCLQDPQVVEPEVRYTVIVTDRQDNPIDSASVKLYSRSEDSLVLFTSVDGQARFSAIQSSQNQFSVSKAGYRSVDSIDQVVASDTASNVILRVVRFRLYSLDSSSKVESSGKLPGFLFTISDSVSSSPLKSVTVHIQGVDHDYSDSVKTDEFGFARSDSLFSGQYILSSKFEGYQQATVTDSISSKSSRVKVLTIRLKPIVP
jgi:hypothetical protein